MKSTKVMTIPLYSYELSGHLHNAESNGTNLEHGGSNYIFANFLQIQRLLD